MESEVRVLVVGAGAIGGYFGGRLLEASRDAVFLVRPRRAAELARSGLVIRSRLSDVALSAPPTVTADRLREPFDIVLLSCKAYDLDDAMTSFAPAVGPETAILPLLNGMRHLEALEARFGAKHVLGGQCLISAAVDADGGIRHLSDEHNLSFGECDGSPLTASMLRDIERGAPIEADHILGDLLRRGSTNGGAESLLS
ncbi:MAG: 2-dehydropantoate 2-reductase N-terminal domain-containing protein, partial [Stellaceae bacterium]